MNRLNGLKKYYHQFERSNHIEKLTELTKEINFKMSIHVSAVGGLNNEEYSKYWIQMGDLLQFFLKNWLDYTLVSWQSEVIYFLISIHSMHMLPITYDKII